MNDAQSNEWCNKAICLLSLMVDIYILWVASFFVGALLHWCYKTKYDSYWFQWEQICEYIRIIKMTICIVSDWNIFVTMEVIMRDWRDKDWQLKTYCCAFWLWELLWCIFMVIRALCPANNQIGPHVSHIVWLWHLFSLTFFNIIMFFF